MEWYNDSIACLEVAKSLLLDIEEKQNEAMINNDVIPYLKVSIKNFLENCRSPLDYAANFIFDTHCRDKYTPHELKKMKIYFPKRNTKSLFEICMKSDFRGLNIREIINIFESAQSYNETWFDDLTKLTNENKHRNLTNQKITNTTHIKSGILGNFHLENVTISDFQSDIVVNGTSYSGIGLTQAFNQIDATFMRDYVFKDLNKNVMETLNPILKGSSQVINSLFEIFETKISAD